MADIDKVTIEELDVADSVGGSDKLIVGSSDGIAKSVTKSVLFNEEKSAREMNDAALLTRIQTMAGQTSDSSEEYPEYRVVEKMDAALKGASNGVAELDENGKVPMSQIPGGADDVRSAYGEVTFDEFGNVTDIQVYEDAEHTVLVTPESHIIYLDIGETQSKNFQYMWSGDGWARLGSSIVIGESASNAYRGDRGKIAYDHSQIRGTGTETATNPHGLSKADIGLGNVPNVTTDNQTPTITEAATLETLSEGDTLKTIIGKVKKAVSSLISHITDKNNPHAVTKAQVGLGNVINVGTDGSVISGSQNNITSGAVFTALSELENRSQKKITGAATSITEDNLTVSKALVSDESGKVAASAVTATELSQLSGVTSNVQEQLNNSIHYCTVLPSAPENRVYGTKETDSFSGAVKKLALTYFELSNGTYVPKKQVESTSLNIGSESSVNVTIISSDFTSINGSITVTDSTAVSGTVTVVRMYAGDTTNCAYYPFGSGDGGNGGMTVECTGTDCSYPLVFYDIGNGTGYVSCCCPISYNPSSGLLDTTVFGVRGSYVGFGTQYDTCCSSLAVIPDQIVSSVTNGEQTAEKCIVANGTTETIRGCCCGICFENRRLIDIFCVHSCVCMCGCDPESNTMYCVSNTVYQESGCAGIWYCDSLTCKCQEIRLASAGIGYTASCHDFSGNILVRDCLHDLCGCAYAKVCDISCIGSSSICWLPDGTFTCAVTGKTQFTDFENKLYLSNDYSSYVSTEICTEKHIVLGYNDGTNCCGIDTGIMVCTTANKTSFTNPVEFCKAFCYRCIWDPITGSDSYFNTTGFGCHNINDEINTYICYCNDFAKINANTIYITTNGTCNGLEISCMGVTTMCATDSVCMWAGISVEMKAGSNTYYCFGATPRVSTNNRMDWKEFATVNPFAVAQTCSSLTDVVNSFGNSEHRAGHWIFSPNVSITDSNGFTIAASELLGAFDTASCTSGIFTGMVCDATNNKLRNISFRYCNSAIVSSLTVMSPEPGTLYGTASPSVINVCGAL